MPVYVAYFKWGSLVATGSQPSPGTAFNSTNVIWAPKEYKGAGTAAAALALLKSEVDNASNTTAALKWAAVPGRTGTDAQTNGWNSGPANGLGDPCSHYFGSEWRLPTGGTGGWNGGGSFGTAQVTGGSNWNWSANTGGGSGVLANSDGISINGAVAGNGSGGKDWTMYLPAAGMRTTSGTVVDQNAYGSYWASVSYDNTLGYSMVFSHSSIHPANYYGYASGAAVRCVRP